jgi:hypothetical protein
LASVLPTILFAVISAHAPLPEQYPEMPQFDCGIRGWFYQGEMNWFGRF